MKSYSLKICTLLALIALNACAKSNAETPTGAQASPAPAASPLKETIGAESAMVAWSTQETVPPSRVIEIGDHPNIKLEKFEIGNRVQRVRFMLADNDSTTRYVSGSPQDEHFQTDANIAKSENGKWSLFSMVIEAPVNLGLNHFSDQSTFNGLSVSPQLILCASKALDNLREAGKERARVFQNWQINDVNLFVKPVQHATDAESKMAIDNKLHALNFQVSLWTRSGDCFLPTTAEISAALAIADQRVKD